MTVPLVSLSSPAPCCRAHHNPLLPRRRAHRRTARGGGPPKGKEMRTVCRGRRRGETVSSPWEPRVRERMRERGERGDFFFWILVCSV